MPVYLRVDSRFPSGHYTRQTLEGRTRKIHFQRWFRVETADKAYGWIPEEELLTPLMLASEAVLRESTAARTEMRLDSEPQEILPKSMRVEITEVVGSWVRARPLNPGETPENYHGDRIDYWIPVDALRVVSTGPIRKVFVSRPSPIFVLPGPHARVAFESKASTIYRVGKVMPGWLQIHTAAGEQYLRRRDAIAIEDLGENGVRPFSDLVPLRSAPLPYANLVRNLKSGAPLKVLNAQSLRWGLARLTEVGEIWWPIDDEHDDDRKGVPRESLNTALLFKRKIFDMASSPRIPSLKFISAQGVYRTSDGDEWTKIPLFQDKNYPIAIASSGAVFVGPFISDDQGETFTQWIRWDSLVSTLKRSLRLTPKSLQIQDIRLEDSRGQRVVLKISIGDGSLIKLITDDQGFNWKLL